MLGVLSFARAFLPGRLVILDEVLMISILDIFPPRRTLRSTQGGPLLGQLLLLR